MDKKGRLLAFPFLLPPLPLYRHTVIHRIGSVPYEQEI